MKSAALPSFLEKYYLLDVSIKQQAKKAYHLWLQNPFHPSLWHGVIGCLAFLKVEM